jgi:hypothetical protein
MTYGTNSKEHIASSKWPKLFSFSPYAITYTPYALYSFLA